MSLTAAAENGVQPSDTQACLSVNGASAPCSTSPSISSQPCSLSSQPAPQFRLLTRPASESSSAPSPSPASVKTTSSSDAPQPSQSESPEAVVSQDTSDDTTAQSGPAQSLFDTANPSVNLHDFIVLTLQQQKDRMFLLGLEQQLIDFVNDTGKDCFLCQCMTSYHRMLTHRVAAYFGLEHNVDGSGKAVIVSRTPNAHIPKQRFKEHIQEADMVNSPPPKAILKRVVAGDNPTEPVISGSSNTVEDRQVKTMEEREAEYEQRRARIFNEPVRKSGSPPPVSDSLSAKQSLASSALTKGSQVVDLSQERTGSRSQASSTNSQRSFGSSSLPQRPSSSGSGQQRPQTTAAFRRQSSGPSHLLVTPPSGKFGVPSQPKWRNPADAKLYNQQGLKDVPITQDSSGKGGANSSGWTQAGPGVLVEHGSGNKSQESRLSAQMSEQLSLKKPANVESTGNGRPGKFSSPLLGSGEMQSSTAVGYGHMPLYMPMPRPGQMAAIRPPTQARFDQRGASRSQWSAGVHMPPADVGSQWRAQNPEAWLPFPTPWQHFLPHQFPMNSASMPVILEVYDLPANLRNYETDILMDGLKKMGASLHYAEQKVFAIFRSVPDARLALKTPFPKFKVRLASGPWQMGLQ